MSLPVPATVAECGDPVWAEVDLGAIRHNVGVLSRRAAGSQLMGVVKAFAYGHGGPESARAIVRAGASHLAVARATEGAHLRNHGIDAPILVFAEVPRAAAPLVVENDLTATVYTQAGARALAAAAQDESDPVPVHLKVDTGMHRLGVAPQEVEDAVREIVSHPALRLEGIWSHLAVADRPEHEFNRTQLERFLRAAEAAEARVGTLMKHLANSAATLWFDDAHLDLVRCGVATYGLWPSEELKGTADLQAALALRARVLLAKRLQPGERLSYGLRYELEQAGNVITVGAGYGDGYDRGLSQRGEVLVRGERHRVSGTICMDTFLVDLKDAAAEVGEVVTLLGPDGDDAISAEDIAALLGTINYEITTRIAARVPRVYLNERDPA